MIQTGSRNTKNLVNSRACMVTRHLPVLALLVSVTLLPCVAGAQADPAPKEAPKAVEVAKPEAAKPADGVKGLPSALQLKAGDASIKFGILIQAQADWQEYAAGYSQNLFLRRIRFITGGQVTKDVHFFFQTESARLGAATSAGSKVISSGFQVLDAVLEWRIAREFNISGGLIYLPTSREALKSSSSQFMMDVSPYAYLASALLGSTGGRDTGFQARGFFLDDRLEYRIGAYQGLRETGSRNAFRYIGRLQYNFFDTELYAFPAYTSSYYGKKKILAIGAAYDAQMDYQGMSADVFADFPTGFGSIVGTATYQHLDGGETLLALREQDVLSVDAGIYFKGIKAGPWVRYEMRDVDEDLARSETRYSAGFNYYVHGNNLNIKLGYTRVEPDLGTAKSTNQFTIQLQAFYF